MEKLKELATEYDYIAFGGLANKNELENNISNRDLTKQLYSFVQYVKNINENCKIHFLGLSHKSAYYCGVDSIDILGHFFSLIRDGAGRIEQNYPSLKTKNNFKDTNIPITSRNSILAFKRNMQKIDLRNLMYHYKYDLKKVQSKAQLKFFSRRII